jgi:photosystem II stability/assembly factor-like uncharacterized protein
MKKIVVLLFCIGILMEGFCQNISTSVTDTLKTIIIFDKITKGEINFSPGEHKVKILDYIPVSVEGITARFKIITTIMTYNVEQGKLYTLNSFTANFYDSITKSVYFNQDLPQIIEKKTSKIVSSVDYPEVFTPFADFIGARNLGQDRKMLDTSQLTYIKFSFPKAKSQSIDKVLLSGFTKENLNISCILKPEEKEVFLEPGYYKLEFLNTKNVSINANENPTHNTSLMFLAEPGNKYILDFYSDGFFKRDSGLKLIPTTNLKNIFFLADGKHGWIVGEYATIASTINGGKTWQLNKYHINKNEELVNIIREGISDGTVLINGFVLDYRDIQFIDSLSGWAASDLGIFHTKDGGLNWTEQNSNTNNKDFRCVHFFNDGIGFAIKKLGFLVPGILYTKDGGEIWKEIDKGSLNYFVFNPDNIWKVTNSDILHSTDMCKTYSSSLPFPVGKLNERGMHQMVGMQENFIFFIDSFHGWILKDGIQHTTDGGKSWNQQKLYITSKLEDTPVQVFFIDKDNGWAITVNDNLFRTTNGGENWSIVKTNNVFKNITKILFINENTGWLLGKNGFFYNTEDGGRNWNVKNILDFIE